MNLFLRLLFPSILLVNSLCVVSFSPRLAFVRPSQALATTAPYGCSTIERQIPLYSTPSYLIILDGDDDDDDYEEEEEEEDEEEDPYTQTAASEFTDTAPEATSALTTVGSDLETTLLDWGGALGTLRQRVEDVETGKSQDPSHALFRMMSNQTPNQIIGQFVTQANPQVVQAMSGAVGSLLGGLSSNPTSGVETLVKASGDKIGSLCFQLQMTGYMFRNAEYVLALKDLMNLKGKASLEEYKDAFHRLDMDGSGYIETSEIQQLFDDVYDGETPIFEIDAFLKFFDQNEDGRISWEEFESGLGVAMSTPMSEKGDAAMRVLRSHEDMLPLNEDDDEDEEVIDISSDVSGTIEIELEDGKVVEVEAKEYIETLKQEAQALKEALRREKSPLQYDGMKGDGLTPSPNGSAPNGAGSMDIAGYIASRQGDVKSLTEGISPEIVDTMKRLVNFVLEGGDSAKAKRDLTDQEKAEMEMEIPGAALQQLALWQLVLGYKLREAEVTGEYKKLLQ